MNIFNIKILVALILVLSLSGCASYMYGYTELDAVGKYLHVDAEDQNFGYKRFKYTKAYYSTIYYFTEEKGIPSCILMERENGRRIIILYYTDENTAYEFKEGSWTPDSLYLSDTRKISHFEWDVFEQDFKIEREFSKQIKIKMKNTSLLNKNNSLFKE
jgi:hypothetical protein